MSSTEEVEEGKVYNETGKEEVKHKISVSRGAA